MRAFHCWWTEFLFPVLCISKHPCTCILVTMCTPGGGGAISSALVDASSFPKWLCHFSHPLETTCGFQLLRSLISTCYCLIFILATLRWHIAESHYGASLHFSDDSSSWGLLHTFIGYLDIHFWEQGFLSKFIFVGKYSQNGSHIERYCVSLPTWVIISKPWHLSVLRRVPKLKENKKEELSVGPGHSGPLRTLEVPQPWQELSLCTLGLLVKSSVEVPS